MNLDLMEHFPWSAELLTFGFVMCSLSEHKLVFYIMNFLWKLPNKLEQILRRPVYMIYLREDVVHWANFLSINDLSVSGIHGQVSHLSVHLNKVIKEFYF